MKTNIKPLLVIWAAYAFGALCSEAAIPSWVPCASFVVIGFFAEDVISWASNKKTSN